MQKRHPPSHRASNKTIAAPKAGTEAAAVKDLRQALLEARTTVEREFRELFESGAELPPGSKEQVEAVLDRISSFLARLKDGDPLVREELASLCAPGEPPAESLVAALMLDAAADPGFRGPGVLRQQRRSPAEQRLRAIRREVEAAGPEKDLRAHVDACERVLKLSLQLGACWLEEVQRRNEAQGGRRLRREIERRIRAGQNPLRWIGDQMNQIVRASAECLREE